MLAALQLFLKNGQLVLEKLANVTSRFRSPVRAFSCGHVRIVASQCSLDNNLALAYHFSYMSKATEAARELAKRSIAVRRKKWGAEGFRKRMQTWGKLGGRPRKEGRP